MDMLGLGRPPDTQPITGSSYIQKLHKYLLANATRLAPAGAPSGPTILQQSYTLLTLGLDPNSKPLSRGLKVPLTLGFGAPAESKPTTPKPLLLRLPPDRLLYLLLRWQSLPQGLPHVGRTDVPIEPGVPVAARGARVDDKEGRRPDGDVQSVRSWAGSMRSVSLGSLRSEGAIPGMGWFSKKQEVTEDQMLLSLYQAFIGLPAVLIHPPFLSDLPIAELVDAGGYTQLGGIDVRIPLDVLRNLQILELEGYDPRGLLFPTIITLRSLTVRDVQDGDDWIEDLLADMSAPDAPTPRFPNLRYLALPSCSLLNFPTLPLSELRQLDLSHNLLNSIPSALASLPHLRSLNLSNNLITSVRNAPAALSHVVTLNLSKNRIDCLVGLDRVLSLERVDVRSNELPEAAEVGRLAVLPRIKEVWCANNAFDIPNEDWRTDLGVAFAQERKQVVVDDRPWTWTEQRAIEAVLASRGYTAGSQPRASASSQLHSGQPSSSTARPPPPRNTLQELTPSHPRLSLDQPGPSRQPTTQTTQRTFTSPATKLKPQPASPAPSAVQKKRRPRRVINLDEGETGSEVGASEIGGEGLKAGSLRLPDNASREEEGARAAPSSASVMVSKRGGNRSRVSARTFEPPKD